MLRRLGTAVLVILGGLLVWTAQATAQSCSRAPCGGADRGPAVVIAGPDESPATPARSVQFAATDDPSAIPLVSITAGLVLLGVTLLRISLRRIAVRRPAIRTAELHGEVLIMAAGQGYVAGTSSPALPSSAQSH